MPGTDFDRPSGHLKARILVPLLVGMGALLFSFVYGISWLRGEELSESRISNLAAARDLYSTHIGHDAALMHAVLTSLAGDEKIREALREQDRELLVEKLTPRFQELKRGQRITHLYFVAPDRTTITRIHRPDFHGDQINRKTTLNAEETGKPSAGVEIGRYRGLLTLRVVHPWYEGEELLGYVEIGKELAHSLDEMTVALGIEMFVVIDKQFVEREYWEEGMRALGREPDWDKIEDGLIVHRTMDEVPGGVIRHWEASSRGEDHALVDQWVGENCFQGGSIPITDVLNREIGRVLVLRDITAQLGRLRLSVALVGGLALAVGLLLALALLPLLGRVEKRIADDVDQLIQTQEELERARDDALAASRAKSDFLASMSHEIRTPMNGVLGMINLLLETDTTDEQQEFAETVRYSAEALLTIINDILDFSKVEAGMIELSPIETDVRQVVDESLMLLAEKAQSKGLDLVFLCQPGVPHRVSVDDVRLRQVLVNLLGNAVKFTDAGEITVELEVVRVRAESVGLRFRVRDTGIGIPKDAQEALFDAFTQADNSTTREFGGTGLGLSISQQLVQLMGGHITVESEPGVGTCFEFTVRLVLPPQRAEDAPERLDGLKALCVGPSSSRRTALEMLLTDWGATVNAEALPTEALATLQAASEWGHPYDAVLVEADMPGLSGKDLTRLIRQDFRLASTHVLMITSIEDHIGTHEAQACGIYASFVKPVRREHLHGRLRALLHGETADSPAHGDPDDIRQETFDHARILVVEDNPVNRRIVQLALFRLNCAMDIAENGQEAVTAVEQAHYDAILMDCQMPVMDGFEATRAIREAESEDEHIPIIALTANAIKGDRDRCLAAGMDDYLSKPVKLEVLRHVLGRWLSKAGR